MAWKVEYDANAVAELGALSPEVSLRIMNKVKGHLALAPEAIGQKLGKRFSGLWKCRVGKWRVIFALDGERQVLTVYRVGRRDQVYGR